MLLGKRLSIDDDDYIGHKPCPKCGSKDNNYRYPDGHEFCFGRCGYYTKTRMTQERICALLQEKQEKETTVPSNLALDIPEIAEDASEIIGTIGLTWIKKYGIHNDEIREHNILWSQSQAQLIFPILNTDKHIIAWQARNFKPNTKKYVTYGKMDDILHLLGLTKHQNTDIIIVEDLVSAIKVSRFYRCLPLFGSGLSKDKLSRISRYTSHIRFWLDSDKLGQSMLLAKMAAQLSIKASVIHTEKDPKEVSNEQIKQLGRQ